MPKHPWQKDVSGHSTQPHPLSGDSMPKLRRLINLLEVPTKTDTRVRTFSPNDIEISLDDVLKLIQGRKPSQKLKDSAERALEIAQGIWRPQALGRWLDLAWIRGQSAAFTFPGGDDIVLDMGFSIQFLTPAARAFFAVYTAGSELEKKTGESSARGDFLNSYILDIIGLAVLEKTGRIITNLVETESAADNWGTGPFLSPGSVHGWELDDQAKLCSVLPLETIGVTLNETNVLSPFKSLSCLLPSGPGYPDAVIGTTCQACSRNEDCSMKPNP